MSDVIIEHEPFPPPSKVPIPVYPKVNYALLGLGFMAICLILGARQLHPDRFRIADEFGNKIVPAPDGGIRAVPQSVVRRQPAPATLRPVSTSIPGRWRRHVCNRSVTISEPRTKGLTRFVSQGDTFLPTPIPHRASSRGK